MSLILVIERSLNIFHPQRQLVHAMPTPSTPFHDTTFSKPPSFIFSSDCGNVSFITTHHSRIMIGVGVHHISTFFSPPSHH
jgi:hypothetical protein